MNTRKGLLPITLGISLAMAPMGAAQAEDSHQIASSEYLAARTTGDIGPKLKMGKVVKKSGKRNSELYAGGRPMFVQAPVLVKEKGKYSIRASVSVRAHHRPGANKKSRTDQLTLTVAVLKKHKVVPNDNNTTLFKTGRNKVEKNGVEQIRIPISKKAAKKVQSLRKQKSDRLYVTLSHAKDTYPEATKDLDFKQVTRTELTTKTVSKKQARKAHARNVAAQKRFEKGKLPVRRANAAGARLSRDMNELYYTSLYLQNNSPFTQSVTVNTDIQCMETTDAPNPMTEVIPANTGGVQLFMGNQNDGFGGQWYGEVKGSTYGSTESLVQDVGQAGREALNGIDDMASPEFYTATGLLTSTVANALTFGVNLLIDALSTDNNCGAYGQYWGVSSTALYVGTPSNPGTVYGNQYYWSTGYFNTAGYGGSYATIGQPQTQNTNGPAVYGSPEWNAMETMLNAAVGQQTQMTYMHNAGMPGPGANIGGSSQFQGTGSFSQGLMQWIYPNAGSCMNNDCNSGSTAVQFGYMMDGFDNPFGPQMQQAPTAQVSQSTDVNTGEAVTQVTCTVPNNGTFDNPFMGSQGQPTSPVSTDLNSLSQMQGVTSAEFVVQFYAQDANGYYLYNTNTTTQASFPGNLSGNSYAASEYPPTLQASGNATQVLAMNEANNSVELDLSQSDLASLFNPSTGESETATSFGCVAVPLVTWTNMNVTGGAWGGNWPFPQVQSGGPLSSPYNNNYNWPAPMNALNMSWSGDAYISDPVAAP